MSESDKVGEVLPDSLKRFYAPTPQVTEDERHRCEVLHIARLMWRGDEDRLLGMIEKARGKAVADRLRFEAREIVREHRK